MWIVDLLLVIPSFLIIAIISRSCKNAGWIVLVLLHRGLRLDDHRPDRPRHDAEPAGAGVRAAPRGTWACPSAGIIFRHIIPNMASLLIIDATISTSATAIIAETGLSYFGFGVQPPDVSLGTLIAEGTQSAFTFPWLFLFAGGLLVLTVLAVNVVGDGLRDALDPASKRAGGGR